MSVTDDTTLPSGLTSGAGAAALAAGRLDLDGADHAVAADVEGAIVVTGGPVEVAVVRQADPPARCHVADVDAGTVIVPPAPGTRPDVVVELTGGSGAGATLVSSTALLGHADPGWLARRVDDWLASLARATRPSAHLDGGIPLPSTGPWQVPHGAVTTTDQPRWLRVSAGGLVGPDGTRIGVRELVVTLPGEPLRSDGATSGVSLATIDVLARGDARSLDPARAATARLVEEWAHASAQRDEAEMDRLQARRVADAERADTALRRFDRARRLTDLRVEVRSPGTSPLRGAVEELGRHQGFAVGPADSTGRAERDDTVASLAIAAGVRTRDVRLEPGWHRRDGGPLLAFRGPDHAAATAVALLPNRRGTAYDLVDEAGSRRRISDGEASAIDPRAVQLSAPLADVDRLALSDVARFAFAGAGRDLGLVVALAAAIALLGLVMPIAINHVFSTLTVGRQQNVLVGSGLGLLAAAVVTGALVVAQGYAVTRVGLKAEQRLQPAVWDRVLRLPTSFFRQFTASGLVDRILGVDALGRSLSASSIGVVLGALFSLVNLGLMFHYEPTLGAVGLAILVIVAAGSWWIGRDLVRRSARIIAQARHNDAHFTGILEGLAAIRDAAAEARFFALHVDLVRRLVVLQSEQQRSTIRLQVFYGLMGTAAPALFVATVGLTWGTDGSAVTSATYFAFTTAFGAILAGILSLTTLVQPLAVAGPTLAALQPVFQTRPEQHEHDQDPGALDGRMALENVSFGYPGGGRAVLDDVSLTVRPGEFVALVGPSGSGKSTLVRLLLGFEEPDGGTVRHGDHDLATVDLAAVRSQLGVVLQDARVMGGTIADNVRGGHAYPLQAVWEALDAAGLARDVQAMPMGVETVVDPAGSTFSGGQVQRLLIARALMGRPAALIMDEATSALDDVTQRAITDSIDRLRLTRLVVAHRLSTIRNADRILVLVDGRIVQQGPFDDLASRPGAFRDFVRRQVV